MLTNERAELLSKYIIEDAERAKALLMLTPEEAAGKINADGYDFSVEEIKEFGAQIRAVAEQEGELDANDLESVAGGITMLGLLGFGFAVKVVYDIGKTIGKNAPW